MVNPVTALHVIVGEFSSDLFRHFWDFDWNELASIEALYCSLALTAGGALCAAAGIGGGGVIVTVLMTCGALSPYDAVPLSKAVVFFGAMCQLALNFGKKQTNAAGEEVDLIDWNLVRVIVPMALTGTLAGVTLNAGTPGFAIVAMLTVVLTSMTFMTLQKGCEQYKQEELSAAGNNEEAALLPGTAANLPVRGPSDAAPVVPGSTGAEPKKESTNPNLNYAMLSALLFIVIVCGVLRHHMGFCLDELEAGTLKKDILAGESACRHPVLQVLFGDSMEHWLKNNGTAMGFMVSTLCFPIFVCTLIGCYFGQDLCSNHGWSGSKVMVFSAMALITGLLAGLVGIGGGLIFSPFLLVSGVEPATAVATSSACVIFTSSSTTMQYMLIDRVRMAMAVFYGIVNMAASWAGTKAVHKIQENFARKSYITFIVAAAVGVSTVLAISKGVQELGQPSNISTPIQG